MAGEESRGSRGGGDRHRDRKRQPRPRLVPIPLDTVEGTRCSLPCSHTSTGTGPPSRRCSTTWESEGAEEIWCLGDLVGYGAEPDDCVALARERCNLSVLPATTTSWSRVRSDMDFSASAAAAARWTQETIGEDTMAYLKGPRSGGCEARASALYHASPRDPVWEYVLSTWQADECMDLMDGRVAAWALACGSSGSTANEPARCQGDPRRAELERELSSGEWLVNPGGVGQRRDGDPRAAWLLLDKRPWSQPGAGSSTHRRGGQGRPRRPGLPQVLAEAPPTAESDHSQAHIPVARTRRLPRRRPAAAPMTRAKLIRRRRRPLAPRISSTYRSADWTGHRGKPARTSSTHRTQKPTHAVATTSAPCSPTEW